MLPPKNEGTKSPQYADPPFFATPCGQESAAKSEILGFSPEFAVQSIKY